MADFWTIKIAGPAGAGIKTSGLLLSELLIHHGFFTADYVEYPSLVRGGHNTYQVTFSPHKVFAAHFKTDLFFSLEPKHWQMHTREFAKKTLIIGDDAQNLLPLKEMAASLGSQVYKNTICLGVTAYLLNLDSKLCQQIISTHFGTDSPNNQAFNLGYDFAFKEFKNLKLISNLKFKTNNLSLYDGNEAFGWGFLRGGGNFYAAYPMSPSSGTLHFLAARQSEYKINVVHPEDEIAAASLCAGAAFAGSRAATGTSGGGFALMTESVSLCGAARLGVVFYLVSRPGPATGLPTWTSQGDLLFAVNSGHGEFNKIVLAPGDQEESFDMAVSALNLAARYNVPVIVLSDKFIAESSTSLPDFKHKKVKIVRTSKALPGTPGQEYMANSYEQDEAGFSVEDSVSVTKSVNSRLSQFKAIQKSVPAPALYGKTSANNLIIGFGSTKSTILEALKNLDDYAFLQIKSLWPLSLKLPEMIAKYKHITVVENDAFGQLTSLLKSQFDFHPDRTILKFDGRPFFTEELINKL